MILPPVIVKMRSKKFLSWYMFRYEEYPVSPVVANYIKKCWVLDNASGAVAVAGKQVLPNGCFNIAFVTGKGIGVKSSKADVFMKEGVYLCGQLTASISININEYTKIFLVQFYPWAPAHFIRNAIPETADAFIDLSLLEHNLALDFDPANEAAVMQYFNSGAFLRKGNIITSAQHACQLIRQQRGNVKIKEVADQMGCSNRYLETVFQSVLGIKPKEYAGIIRIRSLVDRLQQEGHATRFSSIALEEGFYDQAHFIKTFKTMLNISPGKFRSDDYLLTRNGISY